jgi:DNA topoisomerase VI subunit B
MTGQPADRFPDVVVKELIDNGLDAAEMAGVIPKIVVQVWRRRHDLILSVKDNGKGMTTEAIASVLDFRTRTSDKAAYRSTTRGLQGNALKTVVGMPYALGSRQPLVMEAQGSKHIIRAHLDPAGQARIDRAVRDVSNRGGTCWKLALPLNACKTLDLRRWLRGYALFNPHAMVKFRDVRMACEQS